MLIVEDQKRVASDPESNAVLGYKFVGIASSGEGATSIAQHQKTDVRLRENKVRRRFPKLMGLTTKAAGGLTL